MASKRQKSYFCNVVDLILLCLIALLPLTIAQEPSYNFNNRIAEAKQKLLKMIQKGMEKVFNSTFCIFTIQYSLDAVLFLVTLLFNNKNKKWFC